MSRSQSFEGCGVGGEACRNDKSFPNIFFSSFLKAKKVYQNFPQCCFFKVLSVAVPNKKRNSSSISYVAWMEHVYVAGFVLSQNFSISLFCSLADKNFLSASTSCTHAVDSNKTRILLWKCCRAAALSQWWSFLHTIKCVRASSTLWKQHKILNIFLIASHPSEPKVRLQRRHRRRRMLRLYSCALNTHTSDVALLLVVGTNVRTLHEDSSENCATRRECKRDDEAREGEEREGESKATTIQPKTVL